MIIVRYLAVDGAQITKTFKTLAGARKFAHKYVGAHPEIGSWYAVSGDGVGRITARGCSMADLFPDENDLNPLIEEVYKAVTLSPLRREDILTVLDVVKNKVLAIPVAKVEED